MAAPSDLYVVGTCALWAGDTAQLRLLATQLGADRSREELGEDVRAPEDVMRRAAGFRLGQVLKFRRQLERDGMHLADGDQRREPRVLESYHLRGVVWRVAEREFVLRAYLNDLTWEAELFAKLKRRRTASSVASTGTLIEATDPSRVYGPLGATWIVAGQPFLEVEVSDMCLIEARAYWTAESLLGAGEQIVEAFQRVLDGLDESGQP